MAEPDARERLRQHFLESSFESHPEKWDALWQTNFLPWDRGAPNPALVDILSDRQDLIGEPFIADAKTGTKRRKRAFVPGCGKGYDVLLLASHGYDAYGLEASKAAIEACKETVEQHADDYPAKTPEVGSGSYKFVFGNFFEKEWESQVDGWDGSFDLIYDYTFLSALPPSSRPEWAARMSDLLAPSGYLICLEFPTYKPPSTGGPPWALPPAVYEQHLSHPGEKVPYDAEGNIKADHGIKPNSRNLQRIAHWMPERTHDIGKGTDWVSIWRHPSSKL
ncbi:thiol methyltransferase [Lineolata rhizophorae]|uniref:Thiol methyltransferase n=1 Tax=Lineolata rhizophorae TaxID=578093 RepID=A0A6A6P3P7_9PEZI|nr:thiol methyltransferase [Lineolata rhizophorae]